MPANKKWKVVQTVWLVAGGMVVIPGGSSAQVEPTFCTEHAAVAEPYTWYPELDLSRVPFHVSAGPWGPRAPIEAAQAPITTRTVTVFDRDAFESEAAIPGTRIVLGANIDQPIFLGGDVRDLDIVVPAGLSTHALYVGQYDPPSVTERVRIRGSTPGVHSGGRLGALTFFSLSARDVIIDGVDLNGEDDNGGAALWYFAGKADRVAVVRVRGHSVATGSLGGSESVVIAGCSLYTGARPREVNGYAEGWGIRGGDRVVVFDNRIEGTRYHRVRVHPRPGPPQYAWISHNVLVDPHEGRILWARDVSDHGDGGLYAGVWAQCNRVYAHSTCVSPSFDAPDSAYASLVHNTFYGSLTREQQMQFHDPSHDYLTGNTFSPWQQPAAWPHGEPRQIPLPALKPGNYNPQIVGPSCPGPAQTPVTPVPPEPACVCH